MPTTSWHARKPCPRRPREGLAGAARRRYARGVIHGSGEGPYLDVRKCGNPVPGTGTHLLHGNAGSPGDALERLTNPLEQGVASKTVHMYGETMPQGPGLERPFRELKAPEPRVVLSVERWPFHAEPPDHYVLLSYLLDLSVSQLSTLMPLRY